MACKNWLQLSAQVLHLWVRPSMG